MSLLGMTADEYEYMVENLSEAFKLIGQDAVLFPVVENKDDYYDISPDFSEGIDIGLLFVDNPKPILKSLNWLTEDDDLPFVAYIVLKDRELEDFSVQESNLIKIPSIYGVETERRFIISHVRGTSIDPLAWICKLVPYRDKLSSIKESKPKSDTGFAYLNK